MNTEKPMKFFAVRVLQEHADQLEDLRHQRSRKAGKRVTLRAIFAEAVAEYLRARAATH